MSARLGEISSVIERSTPGRLVLVWVTTHDGETRVPTLQVESGPVHDRRYRPASDVDWSLAVRARDDLTYLLDQLAQAKAREAALVAALPDPDKLERIAEWFDGVDRVLHRYGIPSGDGIQRDVRTWAAEIRRLRENISPRAAALLAAVDRLRKAVCENPYVRLPGGRDQHGRAQPDLWSCLYCGVARDSVERGRRDHDRSCFWQVAQKRFGPLVSQLDDAMGASEP